MDWWPVSVVYFRRLIGSLMISLLSGNVNKLTLPQYMNHFNFTGLRLDNAFRCAVISHL